MGDIALSILVCSTDTRHDNFSLRMQSSLYGQWNHLPMEDRSRVEIMVLGDNKVMTIGRKRNVMVRAASGDYVQFVDDDDRVEPDMIATVLEATEHDCDTIVFPAMVSLGGGPERMCLYDKAYGYDHNTQLAFHRIPNHICATRRVLAMDTPFAEINMGEDADYARRLLPKLRSQYKIDRPLYHYDYDPRTSECRR